MIQLGMAAKMNLKSVLSSDVASLIRPLTLLHSSQFRDDSQSSSSKAKAVWHLAHNDQSNLPYAQVQKGEVRPCSVFTLAFRWPLC